MTSPDLSEFEALGKPKKAECKVGVARATLTDADRVNLDAALAAPNTRIGAGMIAKWFAVRDHDVSNMAVLSHRDGKCSCGNGRA